MSEPPTKAPNFLILMADQMTPRALAAYGGRVAKTPNIDRLARKRIVFEKPSARLP